MCPALRRSPERGTPACEALGFPHGRRKGNRLCSTLKPQPPIIEDPAGLETGPRVSANPSSARHYGKQEGRLASEGKEGA